MQKTIRGKGKKTKNKNLVNIDGDFKRWLDESYKAVIAKMNLEFVRLSFIPASRDYQSEDGDVVFSTNHSTKYHRASITIYPTAKEMWDNGKYRELFECITHELSHLHTTHVSDLIYSRFISKGEAVESVEKLTDLIGAYVMKIVEDEESIKKLINYKKK